MTSSLIALLNDVRSHHEDRPAVVQGDSSRSYGALWSGAAATAATIEALLPPRTEAPFVAVVGARAVSAYSNILGIVLSGRGYLPLEPEQAPRRLASLLEQAGIGCIVTGVESLPLVADVCALVSRPLHIVIPDAPAGVVAGQDSFAGHHVTGADSMMDGSTWAAPAEDDDPLYLMFTSGSTGRPKGVVVEHGSVTALLTGLRAQMAVGPDDVVAQLFKLSFDPSVMTTFLAWTTGAALVVPEPDSGVLDEAALIPRHGVSVWASVPSRTTIMRRLRQLRAGAFPGLRFVLQGGEALTRDVCDTWLQAAPAARVVNQYGPTEATVCVTQYVWDPETSPADCDGSRVPIGRPLPGVEAVVVDPDLNEVGDGQTGELLVGGAQVARGYLGDVDRTAVAFVTLAGRHGRFYRTGDLVRRDAPDRPLHFVGRADQQVKVLGRRIELGEVEAAVREALRVEQAVALGWPRTVGGFDGIEVFVAGGDVPTEARAVLAERLPPEAVPRRIHMLDPLPLTANGKVDRRALEALLDESA